MQILTINAGPSGFITHLLDLRGSEGNFAIEKLIGVNIFGITLFQHTVKFLHNRISSATNTLRKFA